MDHHCGSDDHCEQMAENNLQSQFAFRTKVAVDLPTSARRNALAERLNNVGVVRARLVRLDFDRLLVVDDQTGDTRQRNTCTRSL